MAKENSCTPNTGFLCSFEGLLKVIELITVFLAWVICAIAYDKIKGAHAHLGSRYIFFLIIAIICWLFTIFVIVFNLFGCFNKCIKGKLTKTNGWYLFLLAYSLSWFFFWLSGAILQAFHYTHWKGNAAVSLFGIVNAILFFIDSIMYYRKCRKYREQVRKIHRGLLAQEQNV